MPAKSDNRRTSVISLISDHGFPPPYHSAAMKRPSLTPVNRVEDAFFANTFREGPEFSDFRARKRSFSPCSSSRLRLLCFWLLAFIVIAPIFLASIVPILPRRRHKEPLLELPPGQARPMKHRQRQADRGGECPQERLERPQVLRPSKVCRRHRHIREGVERILRHYGFVV
ncbi:hypothetical protein AAVH_14950 [Aphelenchoides avenae]|nr:hypothetical protein AAVH_14950 [Aphelenchus avenae]